MKITYCNSNDDLSFLENKKVILHCERDCIDYAGIIAEEKRVVCGKENIWLVFLSNCPQNCEIHESSTFSIGKQSFKTSMYVGLGHKEFDFVIRYSEDGCREF